MATYESKYSYGRQGALQLSKDGASLVPLTVQPAKPEAVKPTRPAEPISPRSMQVLATLPSSFQMHETRKIYPHVMNRISDAWHDPEFFFQVVRNLLIDQRGGRAGFPFSVLAEVTNLREYYFATVRPEARAKYDREI